MGTVSWSWEANVKPGKLEDFINQVVGPWNIVAEADKDTLLNQWVVDEIGVSVKVYQRFASAHSALSQFESNDYWKKLDDYLEPTGMYVSGDYGAELDFLREHGATFMLEV